MSNLEWPYNSANLLSICKATAHYFCCSCYVLQLQGHIWFRLIVSTIMSMVKMGCGWGIVAHIDNVPVARFPNLATMIARLIFNNFLHWGICTTGAFIFSVATSTVCSDLSSLNNGEPVSYNAGTVDSRPVSTVATYTCTSGYMLNGEATRTCQSTGVWDGSEPSCDCE